VRQASSPDGESAPKGRQFSWQQSRVLVLRLHDYAEPLKVLKSLVSARETPGPPRANEVYATANCSSSGT